MADQAICSPTLAICFASGILKEHVPKGNFNLQTHLYFYSIYLFIFVDFSVRSGLDVTDVPN